MTSPREAYARSEIWFVTGSGPLYGPEVLQTVAEQSQAVCAMIQSAADVPVTVVWKGVAPDHDSIRRVMLDANSDDRVVGVIAWMHTFSPAKMWIAGLTALAKPLLHLHTQLNVAIPWSTIDFDYMNLNQSAHGDREFAYMQTRLSVARKTVVGHASDPQVQREIGDWARAATARADLAALRVARVGDNMRFVGVTEGDKTEAEARLGTQVNTWPVTELADAVHEIADADVDQLVAEYDELYDVAPELRPGGARRNSLRYGAAIELGLRRFLSEGGFDAFTTSFEDLGALRQLPGLAVQRLQADGYGFGAEGDWKTSLLVRAASVMGEGLPGGASLMEDYTYDLTPGDERILGSHMLEVSSSLTSGRPRLEIHPLGIGGREDPVRLVFDADPGPAVVVAMSDMGDRLRLVANAVDVVAPPEPLPLLPVGRALWRPRPDFRTSTSCWLAAGGAHHTVMSTQVGIPVFEDLAEMTGIELLVIDDDTRIREFRKELR